MTDPASSADPEAAPAGRGLGQIGRALRDAARDARRAWSPRATAWALAFVAALLVPLVVHDGGALRGLAAGLYVALAAVGLNLAVGVAGLPSLGQGAFVAIGAFAAALLRVRAGVDPATAAVAGTALAAIAGLVVGAGAIRLRGPFVALGTWLLAWLVGLALLAFPSTFGGAQGIPVPEGTVGLAGTGAVARLTPAAHVEVALVLLGLALAASAALARSPAGLAMAAVRDDPAAARAAGITATGLRTGTFAAAAGVGGLAGALGVQLAGVADPGAYGPLLSAELFLAVLLGGAGTTIGPAAGALALALVPAGARVLGDVAGVDSVRFEPVVAAILLLGAVLLGRDGLVGLARRLAAGLGRSGGAPARDGVTQGPNDAALSGPAAGATLSAREVTVRFGGLVALDGASIDVAPGEVHALVGPNGSGKTTLLRVLAGAVRADGGRVRLGDRDLDGAGTPGRARAGLVRTLQRSHVFASLSVLQHAEAGQTVRRRFGGAIRGLVATPRARAERRRLRREALSLLEEAGLDGSRALPAGRLRGGDHRMLMVTTALAARPRVLLLDEPAAGMAAADVERLAGLLRRLRERGLAVLLVEHNLRLVQAVADRVTVLAGGRVIAHGTPAEVAADTAVQAAYLGPPGA